MPLKHYPLLYLGTQTAHLILTIRFSCYSVGAVGANIEISKLNGTTIVKSTSMMNFALSRPKFCRLGS